MPSLRKIIRSVGYAASNLWYECQKQENAKGFPIWFGLDETMSKLDSGAASISRFGDGEFLLLNGIGLGFQDSSPVLARRLKEVLVSNVKDHLVGIPNYFFSLREYPCEMKKYLREFLYDYRVSILRDLDMSKSYYDTNISQYYATLNDVPRLEKYFHNLRKIWNEKDLLIVKGEHSETDQVASIYDNANSIEFCYAPSKNAFSQYEEIYTNIKKQVGERMVVLALGPTATLLAHDLSKEGHVALDLGHLAKSYDWFKRNKVIKEDKSFFPV
jgi:glycosyltransferase family protein